MNKTIFFLTLGVEFLFTACCMAEMVYLKNRTVVKGRIVERTNSYIKIAVDGTAKLYLLNEIAKIENDTESPETKPDKGVPEVFDSLYVDDTAGFNLRWPPGWVKKPNYPRDGVITARVKTVTKEIPFIFLNVSDRFSEDEETDVSKILVKQAEWRLEERSNWESHQGAQSKVTENPHVVMIGKLTAVRYGIQYDVLPSEMGNPPYNNITLVRYLFYLKDSGKVLSLSLFAHGDMRFDKEFKEMESSVMSLRLVSGRK